MLPVGGNELSFRLQFTINQPQAAEVYCNTYGKINQHNGHVIKLEINIETTFRCLGS